MGFTGNPAAIPLPDPSQVEEVLVDNPPQTVVLPVPEGLPRWP